ncbi:MAG: hypothetical protein NUW37_11305 [Planctomycetes bacterium]|nr:hypothetical protein [Planctomycetota bacterium]
MVRKVGMLSGAESAYPQAVIDRINHLSGGEVVAEFATLDAMKLCDPITYRVVIDRLSHGLPFALEYSKLAVLQGARVINNPYRFFSDKAFSYHLAQRLGVCVPRTVVLPQFQYAPDTTVDDLHNLKYPIDWNEIFTYVGFPAVLKPASGYAWRDVSVVHDVHEFFDSYHQSKDQVMVLQEFIEFELYIRVFVMGQKHTLPIKYDPKDRKYLVEHNFMSPELGERVVRESLLLTSVLDYDMNTCEWAVREGIPYAIDFNNLVPDSKPNSITPFYFERVVDMLANTAIEYATAEIPSTMWSVDSPMSLWVAGKTGYPVNELYAGNKK